MNIDNKLSEIFDVEVSPPKETSALVPVVEATDKTVDEDFDKIRKNFEILLLQGEDALMGALEVAKSSEHPRAYEVVGGLIKQLADVNQQLMTIHQQKQKLDEPKGESSGKNVTNNNAIFVGSTSELNKLIKTMSKD